MTLTNEQASPSQARGIRFTVLAIAIFMLVVVGGFVYRIQQPRVMTEAEMKVNGFYLLQTPRNFGELNLVDHSANVVLINPRGDYHGFFKTPLDLAKMKVTYRSARTLWERGL